jgi:penicillin-binding protein-related factor A (putative recombinase)
MDTGKKFEAEIRASLKDANCFWFRIQDTNDVSRFVNQAVAEKQPGDFLAVYEGMPILIECKTSRRTKSFPLFYGKTPSIPLHQIEGGIEMEASGGLSLFLLRRDEPRKKRVWAVRPDGIIQLHHISKKKSVSWDEIEKHPLSFEIQRLSSPVRWDLEKLFKLRQPL